MKITCLQLQLSDIVERHKPSSLLEGITDSITAVVDKFYWRTGAKKLGKAISNVCWNIKDRVAQRKIMLTTRTYIRDVVYTPQAVLAALDIVGGICSRQAYQVIYAIELMSKDPYKTRKRNMVLLHEWRVREATKKLHKYCDYLIRAGWVLKKTFGLFSTPIAKLKLLV